MGGRDGRRKLKKDFLIKKKKKKKKKTFFHVKNPSRTCMLCCFCYLKEGKYTKPLTSTAPQQAHTHMNTLPVCPCEEGIG